MFVEPITIVRTWLQDATHGVNALLPAVPRYPGHAQPPAVQTIADELTHPGIATGDIPGPYPTLAVGHAMEGEITADQQVQDVGDGELSLYVRYAITDVDAARATLYAGYTLRATLWSLRRLHGVAGLEARVANGMQLIEARPVMFRALYQELESAIVTGALLARYQLRDTGPPA